MREAKSSELPSMRFQEITPVLREEALNAFASNNAEAICNALVRITYHDPYWRWVQEQCVRLAQFPDVDVRGLAVTCLGHIARIHGELDIEQASSTLKSLLDDPEVAPRVLDALDDIRTFMRVDLSKT